MRGPHATERGLRYRAAACITALVVLAACVTMARRSPCATCTVEELELTDANGVPVRGRLYMPPASGRVPAVIVAHGYLANLAFMEVPWATDLAAMGAATVFVDRRGHGRSPGGGAFAGHASSGHPPDLAAALTFARGDERIDPAHLALLGHSDGATAALVAASVDPHVRATVAISASVAPSQIVNPVTPRHLLLVYGEDDGYVLHDTDRELIAAATRGVLDGPGTATTLAGFNARRLVRVPNTGHIDVLFSGAARRASLSWLGDALELGPAAVQTSSRSGWVIGGALALLVTLATALPADRGAQSTAAASGQHALLLAVAWPVCLATALLARHLLPLLPLQEGDVVLALLAGMAMAGALAAMVGAVRARHGSPADGHDLTNETLASSILYGLALAGPTIIILSLLLQHYFDAWPSYARTIATLTIAASALPAFHLLATALRGLSHMRRGIVLLLLACMTVLLARVMLPRMSVLPGYLLAASLIFAAAPACTATATGVFGALLFARAAAAVCAWR